MDAAAAGPAYAPLAIIRLWPEHHMEAPAWEETLALLRRHRGACDEIWFATMTGYPPLAVHRECADRMARAAEEARAAGFLPGLQIANTLGHRDRPMEDNSGADFQPIVGHDGTSARFCFCPRGGRLQDYFRRAAAMYAECRPSSVWIDDDLRMNHHSPVDYGCFCEGCLAAFSERAGRRWERAALVRALHEPDGGAVRLAWTRFNGESLASLARAVAEAVHRAAPECVMAVQNCGFDWSLYNGRNYDAVFAAMHAATGLPVGHRPGAGHYTDAAPRPMVDKALLIGRSVAMQPPCVGLATAEIENWPHVSMGKTAQGTAVEASLDLALGCNSVSFALLCNRYEPVEWYERVFARLGRYRPFWERFLSCAEGSRPGGLWVALSDRHVGRPLGPAERPFSWCRVDLSEVYQMACLGLPLTADRAGAQATLLCGRAAAGFSDGELAALLAGGALLDGGAAFLLQQRGMGRLLGMAVEPFARRDCRERFTDDALNAGLEGSCWRWTTLGGPAGRDYALAPAAGARELARYEDPAGRRVAAATALAVNEGGGRVAVFGRHPWNPVISGALRTQLLRAADWVAGGRLPAILEPAEQVMVVPRVRGDGRLAGVFLLNASIDASGPLELALRGAEADAAQWLTPDAPARTLPLREAAGGRRVQAPPLPPWSVGVVLPG